MTITDEDFMMRDVDLNHTRVEYDGVHLATVVFRVIKSPPFLLVWHGATKDFEETFEDDTRLVVDAIVRALNGG